MGDVMLKSGHLVKALDFAVPYKKWKNWDGPAATWELLDIFQKRLTQAAKSYGPELLGVMHEEMLARFFERLHWVTRDDATVGDVERLIRIVVLWVGGAELAMKTEVGQDSHTYYARKFKAAIDNHAEVEVKAGGKSSRAYLRHTQKGRERKKDPELIPNLRETTEKIYTELHQEGKRGLNKHVIAYYEEQFGQPLPEELKDLIWQMCRRTQRNEERKAKD